MVELLLVRHGQTEANAGHIIQGMTNSDLTPLGISMAQAVGRGLKQAAIRFDGAYSSDLTRAVDTAENLLRELGQADLPVTTVRGLREENYGKYERTTTTQLSQELFGVDNLADAMGPGHGVTLKQIANATYAANADQHPNVSENWEMVATRFNQALTKLAQAADEAGEKRLLVVAHGTVSLIWLDYIGFATPGKEELHNCSVTTITYADGKFAVGDFDDTSYLEAGEQA